MNDDSFRFKIDRIKSHVSKTEIVESLKRYGELHTCATFGMRDYDQWKNRLISSDTIRRTFGTWATALHQAGFRAVRGQKADPASMVDAFRSCWREEKSVPSVKQLTAFLERKKYPFRVKTYGAYFGGLGALAQRIADVQTGKMTEVELLQRITKKTPTRRPISVRLRYSVLKRDHEQCVKCGASPKKDRLVTLEIDHIIPVAEGGTNDPENLQTLCWSCNSGKTDTID